MLPYIELDAVFWQPNWEPLSLDQYRTVVEAHAAKNEWVIDGNYSKVRDLVWARATDVVWMNLPLTTLLGRVISRTLRRIATREELWAGNQETLRGALFSRDSLIRWVIRTHRDRIKALRSALGSDEYSHVRLHEIKTAKEARRLPLLT
jgi:adenylate kinase family enzyme